MGKIVLIHDETPRNQSKLGIITQLHQGKDGYARSVTLKTAEGNHISRRLKSFTISKRHGRKLNFKTYNKKGTKRRTSQEQHDHHELQHKKLLKESKSFFFKIILDIRNSRLILNTV